MGGSSITVDINGNHREHLEMLAIFDSNGCFIETITDE